MKYSLIYSVLFLLLILAGCAQSGDNSQGEIMWRCSLVNCTETINLTGMEWAQQNCAITEQGTLCQVTLPDGQVQVVPIEQFNLSAITATQCVKYTCLEESLYKKVNYDIEDVNSIQ